jgi:hypothetical protein
VEVAPGEEIGDDVHCMVVNRWAGYTSHTPTHIPTRVTVVGPQSRLFRGTMS